MALIGELAAIIAPILIAVAVGYGWARTAMPYDLPTVSALVFYVGTPCLIVSAFATIELDLGAIGEVALAGLATTLSALAMGVVVLKATGASIRAYLPSMAFGNTGNMGLPLCLFAFGSEGLALATVCFAVSSIFNFTVGISVASGKAQLGPVLRAPVPYALAVAVLLTLFQVDLPRWTGNAIELLGGFTIPIMLIMLGVSLAKLKVEALSTNLLLSFVRVGGGAAVGFLAAWALDLDGAARGVVVIQSAMPAAVYSYLFAERYSDHGPAVAGMVVVSTVMSILTLPFLVSMLL